MAINLLSFIRRKRCNVVELPAINTASLQGLPTELQLKIVDMLLRDQILTSVHPSITSDIFGYRVAPSPTCLRDLRCSVLGIVGILLHLRCYFLTFLRSELIALARNYQIAQTNHKPTHPRCIHPFLLVEMATVQMLIAYLETRDIRELQANVQMLIKFLDTGDIRNLEEKAEVARMERSFVTRASEVVKSVFDVLNVLRRSRT